MANDSDTFDLQAAVAQTAEQATHYAKNLFGVREEQFRCNKCNAPCTKSTTHSVATAAFTQGEQPSWYCEACETHYYREPTEGKYTVDMYDRD